MPLTKSNLQWLPWQSLQASLLGNEGTHYRACRSVNSQLKLVTNWSGSEGSVTAVATAAGHGVLQAAGSRQAGRWGMKMC